jgi:hypothetical protein
MVVSLSFWQSCIGAGVNIPVQNPCRYKKTETIAERDEDDSLVGVSSIGRGFGCKVDRLRDFVSERSLVQPIYRLLAQVFTPSSVSKRSSWSSIASTAALLYEYDSASAIDVEYRISERKPLHRT